MSSFSMVLLEEGVEMDLPIELSEAVSLLDQVVPGFRCDNHGYKFGTITRAKLGVSWDLSVKLVDLATNRVFEEPVGCIELLKIDDNNAHFKIPPRTEQDFPGMAKYDCEGKYFGSFIYHMLNTLQERQLIHLPGKLPTL